MSEETCSSGPARTPRYAHPSAMPIDAPGWPVSPGPSPNASSQTVSRRGLPQAAAFRQRPLVERPRERLMYLGPEDLSDEELIAIVFGSGAATPVARMLLDQTAQLSGLRLLAIPEIARLPGIGPARACQLKAALELGRRALTPVSLDGLIVRCAADIARMLQADLGQSDQEALHVFGLDARHRIRSRHLAALGQIDQVQVNPADVFRPLLRAGLACVLIAHNHPSGDPEPSPHDQRLTDQMISAGQIIGIPLLDHIIVTFSSYYSFSDAGLVPHRRLF